jgi:hypothetical protein
VTTTSRCWIAMFVVCGSFHAARGDEGTTFKAMGAVSIDNGDGGGYLRGDYAVTPALLVEATGNFMVLGTNPASSPRYFVDVGIEQHKTPENLRGGGFFTGWRLGGYAHSRVEDLGNDLLNKAFGTSRVLAVYGGYAGGFDLAKAARATAYFDLIVAPVVTAVTYVDRGNNPTTYNDSSNANVGGRFGMRTELGGQHAGLGLDVQLGYRPGIDREFYALVGVGVYFGL